MYVSHWPKYLFYFSFVLMRTFLKVAIYGHPLKEVGWMRHRQRGDNVNVTLTTIKAATHYENEKAGVRHLVMSAHLSKLCG